ncbi:hypothetical protein [Micropruina sp.]|uniref:hypothetical protein n=1 Tax=Micropruina sp. TaxID=2737536 RepID=UPI0039E6141A
MDILEDLREVDYMARWCVSQNLSHLTGSVEDAFDEARSAILEKVAEHAASQGSLSSRHDLIVAGKRAVQRLIKAAGKHRGPAAVSYWTAACDPWDERLLDRLAVHEVMRVLPLEMQETLLTYAAHDQNIEATAKHFTVDISVMYRRIRRARQQFITVWFDWEVPAKPRHREHVGQAPLATHCGRGHEFTPENTLRTRSKRSIARTGRRCRACTQIYSRRQVATKRTKTQENQ